MKKYCIDNKKNLNQNIISKEAVKEKEIDTDNIFLNNVITGDKNYLYYKLKESFKRAQSVDIIVAFLMESGVKMLLEDLDTVINRGARVRILTGNYLNITQPQALYLLKDKLRDKVDLRFYNDKKRSFHPKAYIFHGKLDSEIYIGSSNVSRGALTSSIEWNYRFNKSKNGEDFNGFCSAFEDLFYNHSQEITDEVLKEYSRSWKRPNVYKDLNMEEEDNSKVTDLFEPRGAQIEALYSLRQSREEGYDKGLVVAATGVGKTYLAAFDSKNYDRVLFLAHREEIIKQAAESFKNVRKSEDVGFFYGNLRNTKNKVIFSLVQTLGKSEYLNEEYFPKDYFDYIVVDEFHHAVANNYKKVLEYFKPKFLLGLTATPERLDAKDVFALCDYNNVYEVRLKDAINKGWLVPFRYYGIYDDTVKYEDIEFKNGKYNDKQLEQSLMLNARGELILKHFLKYNCRRTMGFCSSKNHAEYMAKYFSERGVKAVAVYSGARGEYSQDRKMALNNLRSGEVKVIFSVDMFNEGVDVPDIDMVMFLRPTESPTIFLQQLGRGLRKAKGKEYLTVLDFIGKYKNANLIPFLLSDNSYSPAEGKGKSPQEYEYPEDCAIDFDFRLIDIFKDQATKEVKFKDRIVEEYNKIKGDLNHVPSRVEFFTNMEDFIYENIRSKARFNPFNNYLEFLHENKELNDKEELLYNSRAREFINMIETTAMSKTYKMPVFLAFYNGGDFKAEIDEEDIYKAFRSFYEKGSNGVDMLQHKSTKDYRLWKKKEYVKLAEDNPIKYLLKTHGDFFKTTSRSLIALQEDIIGFIKDEEFKRHFKDAIDLRTIVYYKTRFMKKENNKKK